MKHLIAIVVALALTITASQAQTTNSFIITPSAPITIQTAITKSALTVQSVVIDFQGQRMTVRFAGVVKPYVIQGAAFATMKASFQAQFGAPLLNYLQSHPPTP